MGKCKKGKCYVPTEEEKSYQNKKINAVKLSSHPSNKLENSNMFMPQYTAQFGFGHRLGRNVHNTSKKFGYAVGVSFRENNKFHSSWVLNFKSRKLRNTRLGEWFRKNKSSVKSVKVCLFEKENIFYAVNPAFNMLDDALPLELDEDSY